jgi:hypothetical protein
MNHGVWSSHSPVISLRLAVPHRLGDIESDRLHKLIHPPPVQEQEHQAWHERQ